MDDDGRLFETIFRSFGEASHWIVNGGLTEMKGTPKDA